MANCHLRIYHGPEGASELQSIADRATDTPGYQDRVTVALREVLDTLADAVNGDRGWIQDFADDEVTISTDLFEVILAYQHFNRRAR